MKRIALAFVLCIAALTATAGVTIVDNDVTHYAGGEINSPGTPDHPNSQIFCWLYGSQMLCGANNGVDKYVSCVTSDPQFKKLFPMIRKTSYVQFFWDASGACGRIDVYNGTHYLNIPVINQKIPAPVFIHNQPNNQYVYGTVAATASSAPGETIGCTQQSTGSISCFARDASGSSISCSVASDSATQTLADQRIAVTGINESSLVYFSWIVKGKANTCNFIWTINASYQLP